MEGKTYNITRHSQIVYQATFPNTDADDWYALTIPDNIYYFLDNSLNALTCNLDINPNDIVRVVTLGQDYIKFLKKNKLNNTREARTSYATDSMFSDEQLLNLAKSEGLMAAYTLLVIPVVMITEKLVRQTEYKVSQEQVNSLTKYLERIHGKSNVYVYGNIMTEDDILDNYAQLIANGKCFFEKGFTMDMNFKKQKYSETVNMAFLGIPFLVKSPVEKVSFKVEELDIMLDDIKYNPACLVEFTQTEFEKYNINTINFEDTSFWEEMEAGDELNLMPAQIAAEGLEEFFDSVQLGLGS